MARLSKEEEELKINALWKAYEKFVSEGTETPSYDKVTERANKDNQIIDCFKPIGAKTLAQSKNSRIVELRETIRSKKGNVAELKALAPTELTVRREQLASSLEVNAVLSLKIEDFERRLIKRDKRIEDKDNRIIELLEEVKKLRNSLGDVKV